MGLEAVLPTGEIIRTGGKTVKNVVGYDLTQLLVGSEGTLAIITEIMLRLVPKPPDVATLRACFGSVREAADAVTALIRRRVVPATIELMDRQSLDAVAAYVGERLAPEGTDALLLVEIDGVAEAIEAEANQVAAACRESGALEVLRARDAAEREALWRVRRETSYALRTIAPLKLNNDVVVPRGRVPELFALVERLRDRASAPHPVVRPRGRRQHPRQHHGGSRRWRRHGSGTSRREGIVRRCDRARRLNQRRARHRRSRRSRISASSSRMT